MRRLSRRLKKIEQRLCINNEPVVIEYGSGQKIVMSSNVFDKLMKEIRAQRKMIPVKHLKGLPVKERIAV